MVVAALAAFLAAPADAGDTRFVLRHVGSQLRSEPAIHLVNPTISVPYAYDDSITLDVREFLPSGLPGPTFRSLSFRAPPGAKLELGIYSHVRWGNAYLPSDEAPLFALTLEGEPFPRDLPDGGGEFEIKEYTRAADGKVTSFWATFWYPYLSFSGSIIGEIRYNATVTEESANTPPTLAIPDAVLTPDTHRLWLEAVARDDAKPFGSPLDVRWVKIAGPDAFAFDEIRHGSETLRPHVSFSQPGVYRFKVDVSDGEFEVTKEVAVIVVERRSLRGVITKDGAAVGVATIALGQLQFELPRVVSGRLLMERLNLPLPAPVTVPAGSLFEWKGESTQIFYLSDGSRVRVSLTSSSSRSTIHGDIYHNVSPPYAASFAARQTITESLRAQATTSEHSGRYTIVLEPNVTSDMRGVGSGQVVVAPDGKVRLVATLPDGSVVSSGGGLDIDGNYAFALRHSNMRGLLAGSVHFGSNPEDGSEVSAELTWRRAPWKKDPRNPDGFSVSIRARGERYVVPPVGAGIFSLDSTSTTHRARLDDVLWPEPVVFDFAVHPDLTITAPPEHDLHLRFQRETGLFNGDFLDPLTGERRELRGAILQHSHGGGGFFLTDRSSGAIVVESAE